MVHCWSQRPRWGSDKRRHEVAFKSWLREYDTGHWFPCEIDEAQLPRTSKSALRDSRKLPFLRDLLDIAARAAQPDDLLIYSNDDNVFSPGLTDTLLALTTPAWAHRMEFVRLPVQPTCLDIVTARKHPGSDLFAIPPLWWAKHRDEMPDMVIGCEAVDLIMRKLMRLTGGVELHAAIAHEEHQSWWLSHRSDPGERHNVRLAEEWLAKRGLVFD